MTWAEQLAAAVEGVLKDPELAPLLEECEQAVRAELDSVEQPVDDPPEEAAAGTMPSDSNRILSICFPQCLSTLQQMSACLFVWALQDHLVLASNPYNSDH